MQGTRVPIRIGLVLGAGGITGGAYLAGALTAVHQDTGWDPRTADVTVGTSAGAVTGALLQAGVPASDLSAWTVGATLSREGRLLDAVDHPESAPTRVREFLGVPRVPHPRGVWSALRHPRRFDPVRAVMTHLADGERSALPYTEFLGRAWPPGSFYCCAVRRRDGHRVAFGTARAPKTDLATAVAASCAVPGYFAPVEIDGQLYIDGG